MNKKRMADLIGISDEIGALESALGSAMDCTDDYFNEAFLTNLNQMAVKIDAIAQIVVKLAKEAETNINVKHD